MAIPTGGGTETLQSHFFEIENSSSEICLLFGAQHHIYTILSIVVANVVWGSDSTFDIIIEGFDMAAAGSSQDIYILNEVSTGNKGTYVFNDKFAMNGHEPTGYSGALDSEAKQDLVTAQGGVRQRLLFESNSSSNDYDVTLTYIDQDWT